ncbi:MAG: NifB/NifX family molybdenum-iron cluster-binding protein [Candidatus Cloacimonas sp.]|nr:NifB/NifX family molybdenum-iron cluster-binding protein [Candidatus Cloacimonadota bacterium]
MKIVFTATGTGWEDKIDPRFGRAEYLLIFDEDTNKMINIDNRNIQSVEHGAGSKTAQLLFEHKPDVLITGNGPGGNALNLLSRLKINIYVGAAGMTVQEAYDAYKNNKLKKGESYA